MKKLIFLLLAVLLVTYGCDNPESEFGTEGIILTKQLLTKQISSSYFSGDTDPEESKTELINVAGVYRTGVRESMPAISVEIEADRAYMEKLLQDASDPAVTDKTDEMKVVAGFKLLPEDCYQIGNLTVEIPSGELTASVEVRLDKEKLAKLDAFSTWVLPAFRIKNTSLEVLGDVKNSFTSIKMLKTYPELPDNRAGWVNLVQGKPISTTCPVWSNATLHAVTWAVDGDKNVDDDSNRWVPLCNANATIAPWFEIDLKGTYSIDGFQLFYCVPNTIARANCDFWIKTPEGEWKKIAELRNNTSSTPSYRLSGEQATHIRIYWDLIKNSASSYAVKLKEVEVYTNTNK